MVVNWQDKAVQDRLLMSVIASVDNKISLSEIARIYGGDMTYNAVENYLRKFRKEAMTMKAQAEGRQAAAPSPARPRTKKAGDFSPVKGVKGSRVTKVKKAPAVKVKEEAVSESIFGGSSMGSGNEDDGFATGGLDDGEEI